MEGEEARRESRRRASSWRGRSEMRASRAMEMMKGLLEEIWGRDGSVGSMSAGDGSVGDWG